MNAHNVFSWLAEAIRLGGDDGKLLLPSGGSFKIANAAGTDKVTVDSSGNVVAAGELSCVGISTTGEVAGQTGEFTGAVTAKGVNSTSPSAAFGYATGAGGAVTQSGSASTGVTLNTKCGQITTVALTTAAAAEEEFIVTNSRVGATDCIVLSTTYAGAGTPILSVKGVGAGAFTIVISNVHAANALNALMVINFAVIDAVAA